MGSAKHIMANTNHPRSAQNIFVRRAKAKMTSQPEGGVGQDKGAPPRARTATRQPAPTKNSMRPQAANTTSPQTPPTHPSNHKTVHLTLWVKPLVKAEVQQLHDIWQDNHPDNHPDNQQDTRCMQLMQSRCLSECVSVSRHAVLGFPLSLIFAAFHCSYHPLLFSAHEVDGYGHNTTSPTGQPAEGGLILWL